MRIEVYCLSFISHWEKHPSPPRLLNQRRSQQPIVNTVVKTNESNPHESIYKILRLMEFKQ